MTSAANMGTVADTTQSGKTHVQIEQTYFWADPHAGRVTQRRHEKRPDSPDDGRRCLNFQRYGCRKRNVWQRCCFIKAFNWSWLILRASTIFLYMKPA
jgi:hypothetical protein